MGIKKGKEKDQNGLKGSQGTEGKMEIGVEVK